MKKRVVLGLAALAAAAVAFLGLSLSSANAASVSPTLIIGNPACSGLKIDPVVSGTYDGVTITVHDSVYVDFTSAQTVLTVVVKGGPNANLYDYSGIGGVTSDKNLSAPTNPKTGKPYGLSHLCFTFGEAPPPSSSVPPPPSGSASS
jgi:hypothetical protein